MSVPQDFDRPRAWMESREAYYEQHFGPITERLMHSTDELGPGIPHVDIYQFPPSRERDYWTLITSGMSNEPQGLPNGTWHYTELLMYVRNPERWMFRSLKELAEFPFRHETFLYWGHTIPNGRPVADGPTLLTAFLLLPPYFEAQDFDTVRISRDPLHFLWVMPITEAELAFVQENDSDAFLDRLEGQEAISIVVDEGRASFI
jgi:hypothetical protein